MSDLPGVLESKRSSLVVAAAQPPSAPHDLAANCRAHAAAIMSANARLVVFPELSLTGYELDAMPVHITDDAFAPIVDACAAAGAVALVGAPILSNRGHHRHIATLQVSATGVEVAYRKTWLSTEECTRFSPGSGAVMIEIDGWRIGLGICKDTGSSQHTAQIAALGVDIYAAGMVNTPPELALQDERGVAIARQSGAFVIFSSFAGPTGEGYTMTAGSSTIWAPTGEMIARAGVEPGSIARASISLNTIRATQSSDKRM